MQPPWIFLTFCLNLLGTVCWTSETPVPLETKEGYGNSTNPRTERETNERERRLIPYMMYYVSQSLTNPNTGLRQNVFIPITSPSHQNILHYETVPQISAEKLQKINPQFELLPKPVVRVQDPSYVTASAFQVSQPKLQEKPKKEEIRILEPTFKFQPMDSHSEIRPKPIQTEPSPQQVIKINQVPQILKISPFLPKITNDHSSRYSSQTPQYVYNSAKFQSLIPSYASNGQNYYDESAIGQSISAYKGSKLQPEIAQPNQQYSISGLRPDKNTYTMAKIVTSAPQPYANTVKFELNDAVPVAKLRPEYVQGPTTAAPSFITTEKYATTAQSEQNTYYVPEASRRPDSVLSEDTQRLPRLRVPQEEDVHFVATVTPITITNDLGNVAHAVKYEEEEEKYLNYKKPSINSLLEILKETNKLPQNLTPDNIDSSIKILAYILERLQQEKNQQNLHAELSPSVTTTPKRPSVDRDYKKKVHSFPQPSGTSTPGRPGIDYPTYSSIPQTDFDCSTQRYKGFFGDPETKCQVWHYCDLNGGQASFLCPNGTIFSQAALTCDWWFNVKCATTSQLYVLNERLYKYILPFSPSFPEDYSGPIVDRYLTAKFKEMEAKSKIKALKSLITTIKPDTMTEETTETFKESRTVTTEI